MITGHTHHRGRQLFVLATLLLAANDTMAVPMELFGTTVYMTSLGVFLYKYAYLPLMLVLLALLYRLFLSWVRPTALKWSLLALLAAGLASLPWWDVYQTGAKVTQLCQDEGGLHVYRTVEADGFYGGSSIKYWAKYGFRYVESGKTKNGVSHWTLVDGKEHHRYVPEPTARYQWKGKENHLPIAPLIERSSSHVIDRQSGEELGTLVWFTIEKGWFDRLAMALLPGESNPWICGDLVQEERQPIWGKKYDRGDLILATLHADVIRQGKGL